MQLLARGGVGALAILDGPGVDAVRIDPEDGHRADAVVVEHGGRVVSFEVLAQRFGHLDEVPEKDAQADLSEELQVGVGGEHARAAPRRLQREHPGVALAALEQVGHLFPAADEELHVGPVAGEKQAGDVRREAGLVEVDADRVGARTVRGRNPSGFCSKS